MVDTQHIEMTELDENQASPEVRVNEALNVVDGFVFPRVTNMTTNAPPGSPVKGDRYIIGSSPTGDWSGKAGDIALYTGTEWHYLTAGTATQGWEIYDKGTNSWWHWDDTASAWIRTRGQGNLFNTASIGASSNLNFELDFQYWDLTANTTVTLTNQPSAGQVRVTERLIDTNTYTITWPSSPGTLDWGTTGAPSLTNNKLYWFRFIATSAKAFGFSLGEFTP